ncbi:MAG: elongation factor P, partial [Ktedonobacteraceae bacterium]
MISSNEMAKGLTLDIEGEPYTVLEWQHLTKAGIAKIWVKLRHLRTHAIIERTLDADSKFKLVPIVRLPVTFMYWD